MLEFERSKPMRKAKMVELEENNQRLMQLKIKHCSVKYSTDEALIDSKKGKVKDIFFTQIYGGED